MGKEFLIDTNTVIDYLGKKLPVRAEEFLDTLPPVVSVITRMEVLSWYGVTTRQLSLLLPFFQYAVVYPLNETVVLQTIAIRQQQKIKLPDAIIAATAMVHGLDLITRNVKDFKNIASLHVMDVWSL